MPNRLHRRAVHNPCSPRWSGGEEKIILRFSRTTKRNWSEIKRRLPNRTMPAIKSKIRKLRIKHDLFGSSYRAQKKSFLEKVAGGAKPQSVFDAYAGSGRQTLYWGETANVVYASDNCAVKQRQFASGAKKAGYAKTKSDMPGWMLFFRRAQKIYFWRGDAVRAAASLAALNRKICLVDLDTCGTTLPTLPTFLTLLRPGHLVISYGEFHSLRFGRKDVLRRILSHRNINSSSLPKGPEELAAELHKATLAGALRSFNDTGGALWLESVNKEWLGSRAKGILRRHYKVVNPRSVAGCLAQIADL